jgi:glycosyltransferase involved in cell wall biosynthesis
VVLPVRNEERFIEAAIGSILGQTFGDFELIVIDDGSSDGTSGIVSRLAATDGRIRVVRLEGNGVVEALNAGVASAKGTYVARMDADDLSLPERFSRQVAELDRRPSLGVLGTRVTYVDVDGMPVGAWDVPVGAPLVRWSLAFGTPIAHPSVMMRRSVLPDPPYRADYPYAEDFDLWVRLSRRTFLDNLPQPLLRRRVHGDSVSDRNTAVQDESTLRIRRLAITSVLGNEPSVPSVAAMTRPSSLNELLLAMRSIGALYRASPRNAAIRRDAVRRFVTAAKEVWRS